MASTTDVKQGEVEKPTQEGVKEKAPKETVSPSEKRFGDSVASNDADAKVREKSEAEEDSQGNPLKPIGQGVFGNIYDQFKGKVKEAFNFLMKHKEGDLLGVFHREGLGDIDLVWGDKAKEQGLDHIIDKHIERYHDFANAEEAMDVIDDVINNGTVNEKKSRWDKVVLEKDGYMVIVSKNVRDNKGNIVNERKNWVVTAFDNSRKLKEKSSSDITRVTPNTNKGGRAVTPDEDLSENKATNSSETKQEGAEESVAKKKKDGTRLQRTEEGQTVTPGQVAAVTERVKEAMPGAKVTSFKTQKEAEDYIAKQSGKADLFGEEDGKFAGATLPNGEVVLVEENLEADTSFHEFAHKLYSKFAKDCGEAA